MRLAPASGVLTETGLMEAEAREHLVVSVTGDLVLMGDQDRSLWNRDQIDEGCALVERALADAGALEVRTVRLDDYCAEHGLAPAAVKIDVEGAELAVLAGARETLARHRPVVFLSTHGPDVHAASLGFLRGLGYRVAPILGGDVEATTEVLATP